jgi:hypothetical protein
MGIGRAAVIVGICCMSLAGMEREVQAQHQRPLPPTIGPAVTQEFRESGSEASRTVTETSRTAVTPWRRVLLWHPLAAHVTRRALDRAHALLEQPACAAVLSDFKDGEGRVLTERLSALGVDAQTYLGWILFIDGTREALCTKGAVAFTAPGIRIVRLCATEVTRVSQLRPDYVAGALIHEMLHTLGLGENPPASHEITRRVLDRCALN